MPLQKTKGHMYPWVSHTHSHLGGECPHKCVYCYVDHFPFGRPQKYQGELRLIEKEFSVNYGSGKTIFIENCNDLFANKIHPQFIERILHHCNMYPENTYIFQTKNPQMYSHPLSKIYQDMPPLSVAGATIETNRYYPEIMGNAPKPEDRLLGINKLPMSFPTFLTIEPILDFDLDIFSKWIRQINPNFVNIGADSKKHSLPEPTPDKIHGLIAKLNEYGIEIREKHNLQRLKIKGLE